MKNSLTVAAATATLIVLSGCQTQESKTEPAKSAAQASYEMALSKAKKVQSEANGAKNEWRDTAKLLKKAEELAAKGDYAAASKMAMKAEAQGQDALAQAAEQKGAGNPSYLY